MEEWCISGVVEVEEEIDDSRSTAMLNASWQMEMRWRRKKVKDEDGKRKTKTRM